MHSLIAGEAPKANKPLAVKFLTTLLVIQMVKGFTSFSCSKYILVSLIASMIDRTVSKTQLRRCFDS